MSSRVSFLLFKTQKDLSKPFFDDKIEDTDRASTLQRMIALKPKVPVASEVEHKSDWCYPESPELALGPTVDYLLSFI